MERINFIQLYSLVFLLLECWHERHRSPLPRPNKPQLGEVGHVLHELGVVRQGQGVAVDGVRAGEGDIQPGQPPSQGGPAVTLQHFTKPPANQNVTIEKIEFETLPTPPGAVSVEGCEAELLLPVNAEPGEVRS